MEYPELAKLFHMDKSSSRNTANIEEFQRRKTMDSTFLVRQYKNGEDLFIAMPREMLVLMESVLRADRKSSAMMRSIPPIGVAALIRGLVLDEVVSTNAIEDIHSTRKQIEEALEAQNADNVQFRRFKELALLYMGLSDNPELTLPEKPKDIRTIYDAVMESELLESKKPDGELFRKDGVDVKAGGIRVLHRGAEPESKIIDGMENMLALTKRDDIPGLISAIASHYIFESVHPFYDGNGRTGRYLLALFLSEPLSTPTVLSLSRAIAENKNAYYSAFSSVENPLNHGEMTHFVYSMLELIKIAQSTTMERLKNNIDKFELVKERCEGFFQESELGEKEETLVFVMAQYALFGMFGSVSLDELAASISLSKQMARKYLTKLENNGLVEVVSKRPLKFALTVQAKEMLGITEEK